MKVAFIGLGNMGGAMASNLLATGQELTVWNRTRSRAEKLEKLGARIAESPGAAAAEAEVAITMVADDRVLEEVVFGAGGLLERLPAGSVHLSMSTISVDLAKRLEQEHRTRGQEFVSAPVFGRPEAAQERKLFIVAAGPVAALKRCKELFAVLGQRTFIMGETAPAANLVKLSGNFLIGCVIESMAEAMALARKHGVDPQAYYEMLTNSLFAAPVYKTYGARIASDNYEPVGFRLLLGLKDVRLVLAAAESTAVPMPFANVIRDRLLSAIAGGMQDADWSAFARLAAADAGLKPSASP
jgi:3-hydroxyisobutyrate dehydrogenase-like beta-hydroxyacid dehydrogenase